MTDSPQLARALAGYDKEFQQRLLEAITQTVARESIIVEGETRVMALRTGETVEALLTMLISTMAMSPTMDDAQTLRQTADKFAKRIRRGVATIRAEGTFNSIFGTTPGGQA